MKTYNFTIDGHNYEVTINDYVDNVAEIEVNGTPFVVQVNIENENKPKEKIKPVAISKPIITPRPEPAAPVATANVKTITAQLSGTIMKINVAAGDAVKRGDVLLTMEAMKMENNVLAEQDGVVNKVYVSSGQNVMQDAKLVDVEVSASSAPAVAPAAKPAAPAPAPTPAPAPADAPKPAAAPAAGGQKYVAPLPGSVFKILVSEGQAVKRGDTVVVLEAMKMENNIMADKDGTIGQIAVTVGQAVAQDELLFTIV